jgi:hypothetical protein
MCLAARFRHQHGRAWAKALDVSVGHISGVAQVRSRLNDANLPKPTQVHLVSCMKEIGVKKLLQSLVELVRFISLVTVTLGLVGCPSEHRTEHNTKQSLITDAFCAFDIVALWC